MLVNVYDFLSDDAKIIRKKVFMDIRMGFVATSFPTILD